MDIALARAWVAAIASAVADNAEYLTRLDAAIGDGDHGVNLHRGFTAVVEALDGYEAATVGDVLVRTGSTLVSKVGGASGPLYAPAVAAIGKELAGGGDLAAASAAAAAAAEEGMRATTAMVARKGRASYLGPRSEGHQDPGATSTWLIFRSLAEVTPLS